MVGQEGAGSRPESHEPSFWSNRAIIKLFLVSLTGGSCIPYNRFGAQPVHCSSGGRCSQGRKPPIPWPARHAHIHICIPNPGISDQFRGFLNEGLGWGTFLHFNLVSLYSYPLPPNLNPQVPPTTTHHTTHTLQKGIDLLSRILNCKKIPLSVLILTCPVLVHGKKWNAEELVPLSASHLLCHGKWMKAWMLLSIWLIVPTDCLDIWFFNSQGLKY